MRRPASPPTEPGTGYGFGLQLLERDGRSLFGHGGSMPGFLAMLAASEDDDLAAVALSNVTAGPRIGVLAADLIAIVAENEPRLPERWTPRPGIGAGLLALTGLWYWGPRPTALRILADDLLELDPVSGPGRARMAWQGGGS